MHLGPTPESPAPDETLRSRKKSTARASIVDAALVLFAEQGFDNTTVAEIADRANVSPATVARYFPSKEELLFAERDERVGLLHRSIVGRPAEESALAAVVAALMEQPWISEETGDRLLRSRAAIARSAVLRGRAGMLLADWRSAVADALEQRGEPALEAWVVSTVVVSLLDGATERWADDGGATDLGRATMAAFAALDRVLAQQRPPGNS